MVFSSDIVLLCLFLFGLFRIIIYYFDNREFFKKAALLPGPPTIPILGNTHLLFKRNPNFLKVLNKLSHLYPSPFRMWIANNLYVNIYDPQQVKTVLFSKKVLEKASLYKFFQPWLGTGIFTASVPSWRVHRKLISPVFQTKNLQLCVEIFQNNAVALIDALSENCNEFVITEYLNFYALKATLEGIMGDLSNLEKNEMEKYAQLMARAPQLMKKRMENFLLHPNIIFNLTQLSKTTNENISSISNFIKSIIEKRRNLLTEMDGSIDGSNKTFLNRLIEQCDDGTITEQELLQEVNTMFFAATDTTLATLSFVILVLVTLPDIQEKVYEELHQIFGDADPKDYPTSYEDLCKMDYLTRVIKETLRYFPPVPYILRKVMDDLYIGRYTLPKGSEIFISILKLHHNKEFWHEPEKFDPDRFLPDEVFKRPTHCYIPFSSGPRNCIGFKFGMISIKIVLSMILRKFVLTCDDKIPLHNVKLNYEIFIKPCKPLKIKIHKR